MRWIPKQGDEPMSEKILEVKGLKVSFFTEGGEVKAVDDVSFDVLKGKTSCVVGESGCGKSVTSLAIMRLIPSPPGKVVGGEILLKGRNLLTLDTTSMRKIRGREISMIFQEPMTSLNPVFTLGNQLVEAVLVHQDLSKKEALNRAIEMLRMVGIPSPEKRVHDYPHQLSGGMRQRVMIAMALSNDPELLIADEPTTALDVTIQAQILQLMLDLKRRVGAAIMLITHDLGVVAEVADRVVVMYAGRKVEEAPVRDLFRAPRHPYTRGLMGAVPKLGAVEHGATERLAEIPGIETLARQIGAARWSLFFLVMVGCGCRGDYEITKKGIEWLLYNSS
jgi:peptide/nickel transport system ATP-binding protein